MADRVGGLPQRFILVLLVWGVFSVPKPAAGAEELFVEGEISSFLARDMDGDGRLELWVSYHENERRFLALFAGGKRFRRAPDRVIGVDPQAVLFTVGDFGAQPGLDLVFVSRSSGVALPVGDPSSRYGLFRTDLFFNMPSPRDLPPWLGREPVDLDGDGREDFLVPERRQLRVLMGWQEDAANGEGAWRHDVALPIDLYALVDGEQARIRNAMAQFADIAERGDVVLATTGAFPYPVIDDFDSDGRLDLIVKRPGNAIEVYRQTAPGQFHRQPIGQFPWMAKSTSVQLIDIDGDGRLDLVASNLLLKELATEVRVYLQGSADVSDGAAQPSSISYFDKPQQALRISGFFRRAAIVDVNGDERADLVVAPYRVDRLDQLRNQAVDELEITYQVFLKKNATSFARTPALKQEFRLRTAALGGGSKRPSIYFGEDVTGDGRGDVLFIDPKRWLRLYGAVGGGVAYEEVTGFATRIPDPQSVSLVDLDGRAGVEVILRCERSLQVHRHSEG